MGAGQVSARQSISGDDTGRDWAEGDTGLAFTRGEGGGVAASPTTPSCHPGPCPGISVVCHKLRDPGSRGPG